MIAHGFEVYQRSPMKTAADLSELFAPLFQVFAGKRQVLQPHCIGVSVDDIFVDGQGRYLAPVASSTPLP